LGEITAIVRTERHPKHRGVSGAFSAANYNIDIANLACLPFLVPGGQSGMLAKTQVVIRIDRQGKVGVELFSVGKQSPFEHALVAAQALDLHEVDCDLARFFTPESVEGNTLIYRPVTGVEQNVVVTGYEETVRTQISKQHEDTVAPRDKEAAEPKDKDLADERGNDRAQGHREAPTRPHETSEPDDRIHYKPISPKYPIDPFFFLSTYAVRPRRHE
jgi:hypothetical protein